MTLPKRGLIARSNSFLALAATQNDGGDGGYVLVVDIRLLCILRASEAAVLANDKISFDRALPETIRSATMSRVEIHGVDKSQLAVAVQGHYDNYDQLGEDIARLVARRTVIQAHHTDCCGLLAPVRRLPSEILVLIFGFCRTKPPYRETYDRGMATSRLAQAPLLAVAQVCAGWCGVTMGTPSLWDTVELDSVLWKRLHRCPIEDFNRQIDKSMSHPRTQQKLPAQGLYHWYWMLSLDVPASELQYLSSVRGKLPVLETLVVHRGPPALGAVDFFQVAPRLRTLVQVGSLSRQIPKLLFEQFQTVEYTWLESRDVATVVPRMANLSGKLRFEINLAVWSCFRSPAIPPISEDGQPCNGLDDILQSLTLPYLRDLTCLKISEYPARPLRWTQTPFLGLAARSSFDTHLETLRLPDIAITEAELLKCLSALPLLQRLEISDHTFLDSDDVDHHLISDTLLAQLTRSPSPTLCLVHHLRALHVRPLLQFDDNVYLHFVLSRLHDGHVFESGMRSLRSPERRRGVARAKETGIFICGDGK
ncbi:hypothetical protein C8R44DRAFT_871731 [Mycena epipterygia]|nr:hypothetical protein C8R44DRAFT_871731 [Mycena epipterygia]